MGNCLCNKCVFKYLRDFLFWHFLHCQALIVKSGELWNDHFLIVGIRQEEEEEAGKWIKTECDADSFHSHVEPQNERKLVADWLIITDSFMNQGRKEKKKVSAYLQGSNVFVQ